MERKKATNSAIPLSSPAVAKPAQVLTPVAKAISPSRVQIADLLFELQGDNSSDHRLNQTKDQLLSDVKRGVADLKREQPKLLGLLGRCAIEGCDVHKLDDSGNILEHYSFNESLPAPFAKARSVLANSAGSTIGILVYDDHLEFIFLDGSTKRL